ncbi:hypothetical protein DFH08DRAFT_794632 [Mycena albidolilacea]|uniref:Uncharacterized protein n=1 Tax=Mycena albidolilacea TaxID=1033008 RepID=A0AAD7E8V5_9AGAR|nr:hypothetical protein DFH08DRAFT_794632 [Mycena albidolilacea]
MEAFFDNKTNIVNARICAVLDEAVMYSVQTKFEFQGRVRTILRDENPLPGTPSAVVGAINWKEKTFEVQGQKCKYDEIRRTAGSLFNKTRLWRWSATRKEYDFSYTHEEWKATIEDGRTIAGRFCVPFRPHLFSKSKPAVIHLTSTALAEDEVFLLLVFIYEEVKRQDKTNTSTPGGTGGW